MFSDPSEFEMYVKYSRDNSVSMVSYETGSDDAKWCWIWALQAISLNRALLICR